MAQQEARDLFSGAFLILIGVAFSFYAWERYSIGTLRQMGPGLFPVALGAILAVIGLGICLSAWFRRDGGRSSLPVFQFWTPLLVLVGVVAFALTIRPFGLIPAIVVTTIVSSFAEMRLRFLSTLILCVVLSVFSWLVFGRLLGLSIPLFRWPF